MKIKNLYCATVNKLGSAHQAVIKNRLVRRVVKPKLSAAYLELTNNCNLNCKMCIYKKLHGKTGNMSRSLYESCVTQLSEMGLDTLYLHFGGESLLHPEFKDFLKFAVQCRDKGGIRSIAWIDNGMLFNQNIADLVVDLKVDTISFSLDGVGEVNDRIRLGSIYSVIEKNIKYLIKKRGGTKKPQVYLSMCDFGKSEEQEAEVYREWISIVDSIGLIPSIRPDNTWENKDVLTNKHKMANSPAYCSFPFETMAISWDGKVTGCCLDYAFKMDLGDATKEPLRQIWMGPRFQALRKASLENNFFAGSPCYKCEFWQINFKPKEETILNGAASIKYGYIYRKVARSKRTNIKQ